MIGSRPLSSSGFSDAAGPMAGSWPRLSIQEAQRILTAPGQRFEIETVDIGGVPTRTWKNAVGTFRDALERGRAYGSRDFIVYQDERVSYEGLYRAATTLADHLTRLGVEPGDRVALAMRNLPEWPVAFFAASLCGAIICPLNAWWTASELSYALKDCGARILICDAERALGLSVDETQHPNLRHIIASRMESPLPGISSLEAVIGHSSSWIDLPDVRGPSVDLQPDDDATLFYTSGTTGTPKGAVGTHRNILTNPLTSAYSAARSALRRGEAGTAAPGHRKTLLSIPLFHVTGCSSIMIAGVINGVTLVMMHRWNTDEALALIERERINVAGGVPTIAWQLLDHPDRQDYDLSSLDTLNYGGAPSAPELAARISTEFSAAPSTGWGMTETSSTLTHHMAEDYLAKPTSCGPATPVSDLKIMASDGQSALPVGEIGEIWARGPQVLRRYWNNPEATAETFENGWVRSGDLGYLDDEDFLFIADRAKDVIIRGGENIYCREVEIALHGHAAVADVAVVALLHRTLGEEPAALVQIGPDATTSEAELKAWARRGLASFKIPVRIVLQYEPLPRNVNGKVMKPEVRQLILQSPTSEPLGSCP